MPVLQEALQGAAFKSDSCGPREKEQGLQTAQQGGLISKQTENLWVPAAAVAVVWVDQAWLLQPTLI